MESILNSIKKLIGLDESYTQFDTDMIIHINSAIASLNQIGVGPKDGFRITGVGETWNDFIGDGKNLSMVKDYIYLKVKLIFDTPSTSFVIDAYEKQIAELEWRLNVQVDPDDNGGL